MGRAVIELSSYEALREEIRHEIARGIERAQRAFEREKVASYWKIGRAIHRHLKHAAYGDSLLKRLARDLSLNERLLYQASRFYASYPGKNPPHELAWSHYRLLSAVEDPAKRKQLERKAAREDWSFRALRAHVKLGDGAHDNAKGPPKGTLSFCRGSLYTYRVFKAAYSKTLLIDLGFKVFKESSLKSKKGDYIRSLKEDENFTFKFVSAKRKHLYTWKAHIEQIIDGDTLWTAIDLGFQTWTRQKVRLRGLNAPAVETSSGELARAYLRQKLGACPFVVLKSHGRDKYDRYLVDLFYSPDARDPEITLKQGAFLNQELLGEGLADLVR
jgi:endonuclease YncB( thermonuclease family)